ncbi:MAG TPA: tRNA 2-thiouridine(34) synthase MnmA [Kineosporiaceae bacterium]|nr:tRNA 2-thiouridine(34) synthase MnmA [Kineosporiaceae bacterium]
MKVLAAMSGGVDSAVAAARAVDAGHEVVGVHLALARDPATLRSGARGCCSVEDARDARRAADVLGIPFYVWDLAERFERDVVADFVTEYAAGRTPNPCVRCNERIKFSALLDKAMALGFDAVCTGHYARIAVDPGGARSLHRAVDAGKDQSYVLAVLTPQRLRHAIFPLGDTVKVDVRREAAARGLRVAAKPDSHDICFVPNGDTKSWLGQRLGRRPGPVLDADGQVVGEHDGAFAYTVGQRHGLRLGRPAADGRPRYVLEVRPATDTVVVGPRGALEADLLEARGVTWCGPAADRGDPVGVQVRAHGEEFAGVVETLRSPDAGSAGPARPGGGLLRVRLDRPVRAAAPGQTLALYAGTRVLGSGTLTAARASAGTGR